jgi:hypothetical protein
MSDDTPIDSHVCNKKFAAFLRSGFSVCEQLLLCETKNSNRTKSLLINDNFAYFRTHTRVAAFPQERVLFVLE